MEVTSALEEDVLHSVLAPRKEPSVNGLDVKLGGSRTEDTLVTKRKIPDPDWKRTRVVHPHISHLTDFCIMWTKLRISLW
jgi:hypothetical protein